MRAISPAWKRIGQLLLTGVVTVFIFRQVGVSWQAVTTLNPDRWRPEPLWMATSLGMLGGAYLASAVLWGRMVRELGGPSLGARKATAIYMTANLGRYIPGKIWQLVGLAVLARDASVPASLAAGAAVLGQVTALAGASLVGSVALLSAPVGPGAVLAGAWTLLVLLVAGVPSIFNRVLGLAARLAGTDAPLQQAPDPLFGVRWVLLYALNWVLYAAAFWALARSFSLPGELVSVGSSFAAAYVLGYLALFAPAGIGVREGFLVAFLDPIVGTRAVGLAVVARLWTTAVELVTAGAAGSWARVTDKGREDQQ
jgi:hypothetical protein